ncbi:hypothetical protein TRFO_14427 [Tritrichomonas foetus]|uniref:Uncharacterized protein n=1 Tax=Tritrichomonas foetus TaxID=1144522 RepID=A0A1J4KZG7_9EUKA|nr:hypothetical protein TRFO_14427 [Tritrichomonas foetus]|eukprot:OHT15084.1 hypothetical protein TRFO_14427 [Tritrichomonas foetus]
MESKRHITAIKDLLEKKDDLEKITKRLYKQKNSQSMIDKIGIKKNLKKKIRKQKPSSPYQYSYATKSNITTATNESSPRSKNKNMSDENLKKSEALLRAINNSPINAKSKSKFHKNTRGTLKTKRKAKSPQQIYDDLNRNSYMVKIRKYKNSSLVPEPFKPSSSQVEVRENIAIQSPASLRGGSDFLNDRMKYFQSLTKSRMKRKAFNSWVSKWGRNQVQKMRNDLKMALENKKAEKMKREIDSSTDSEMDKDLPPLFDEDLVFF